MGLERLTLDDRERHGVKDYSELFSQIALTDSQQYFAGFIGQDEALEKLFNALGQKDVRGICLLGDRGVGKSYSAREIVRILRDMDNGTIQESKYVDMLHPLHERFRTFEKGDQLSLWHPDSLSPHLIKLPATQSSAELQSAIDEDVISWQDHLLHKLNTEMNHYGKSVEELQDPDKQWEEKKKFKQRLQGIFTEEFQKIGSWESMNNQHLRNIRDELVEKLQLPQYINQLVSKVAKRITFDGEVNEVTEYHTTLEIEEGKVMLEKLLLPKSMPYAQKDRVNIHYVTNAEFEQLCPTVEWSNDKPAHHSINLGIFAQNQMVVIDDNGKMVCLDDKLRNTLLPYLDDGHLRSQGRAQIEVFNPGLLVIADSKNPFYFQPYENRDPEPDEGMERRFITVNFKSGAKATDEIASNMGQIMHKRAKEYDMTITPEATNLLYHLLLNEASEGLVPLTVGEWRPRLVDRPLLFAKNSGRTELDAQMVKAYTHSLRNLEAEHTKTQREIKSFHRRDLEPRIGSIFGLAVWGGVEGVPGAPFRKTASILPRAGEIFAPEWLAEQLDETYKKGILCTQSFLEHNFGPIGIRTQIRIPGYSDSAGPSSSAAITYALMSAFGNIPVDQRTFMTGTMQDEGEGIVGRIGAVFEKIRGAYHFAEALERKGVPDVFPIKAMIPESNADDFLRQLQYDDEIQEAMEEGKLSTHIHHNIWEGFEDLSGLPKNVYTKRIRKNIKKLRRDIKWNHLFYPVIHTQYQ